MFWIPDIMALDFETTGLEFYRPDFRVESTSVSYFNEAGEIQSHFLLGEDETRNFLKDYYPYISLVVHNAQFEMGVFKYRFPEYKPNIVCDTMRLTQVVMGKGEGKDQGYGLEKCIRRCLDPKYHNHKARFLDWIIENKEGVKKRDAGKYLSELPRDMLREYNTLDTVLTLKLYCNLVERARSQGYDWSIDHMLYLNTCRLLMESKGRGVPVDLELLDTCITFKGNELRDIEQSFKQQYLSKISEIEKEKENAWINELKTVAGRNKRKKALEREPDKVGLGFKVTSPKDMENLFVRKLGIEPKFTTPTGMPSFKAAHMKSYGEGGEILERRGSINIALKQSESLKELSSFDGRYHPDLKPTGTNSGRLSGGHELDG